MKTVFYVLKCGAWQLPLEGAGWEDGKGDEETARIDVGQTCMQSWKLTHEFGNKIQFVPSIDKRNFTYGRMVYNKYVDWHYNVFLANAAS